MAVRITVQFVVVLCYCQMLCSFIYHHASALKVCDKKLKLIYMHGCCSLWWIGLFKSAAVQSDQSQEFKFVHFPDSTNCSWITKQRKHWLCVAAVNQSLLCVTVSFKGNKRKNIENPLFSCLMAKAAFTWCNHFAQTKNRRRKYI